MHVIWTDDIWFFKSIVGKKQKLHAHFYFFYGLKMSNDINFDKEAAVLSRTAFSVLGAIRARREYRLLYIFFDSVV